MNIQVKVSSILYASAIGIVVNKRLRRFVFCPDAGCFCIQYFFTFRPLCVNTTITVR